MDLLRLGEYHFPIVRADFRRILDDGLGRPGWELNVSTGPPIRTPADGAESGLFDNGVRFFAEGDPIPLPDLDELTGVVVDLPDPYEAETGEVYFTLYVGEYQDVSSLVLRLLERDGSRYRMTVTALAHQVFEVPTSLEIETWIERLPAGSYGKTLPDPVPEDRSPMRLLGAGGL